MNNYKELKVWQYSIELSSSIYLLVKRFPIEEKYGSVDQLKRCAVSIAANIAEGSGRNSNKEFNHFLAIANGSCCELDTLLIICQKASFLNEDDYVIYSEQIKTIQKMIKSLQYKLTHSQS